MRKKLIAPVVALSLLALAGCAQSTESQVQDLCVKAAAEKVGAEITMSEVKTTNLQDAFYEAGITDSKDTDEKNATYTVLATIKWKDGTVENRREMTCTVAYRDGTPDMQIDLS